MKKPENVLAIFEKYIPLIDADIEKFLATRDKLEMYRMMEYFLGYRDENLKKNKSYAGKRFRSGLTMLLSDFYGNTAKTLPAASGIEIFHNFSLIHDDVEDNDSLRRGKPTVWKLWGVNQAINTGDAQLALAYLKLSELNKTAPKKAEKVQEVLYETFLRITEGQYMDIRLAETSIKDPFVNVKNYQEMIYAKTSVLVGASAMVAGLLAGKSQEICQALWDYGTNLGMAFQYADDLISIWGSTEDTGKVEAKDLAERKKTLPVIYLFHKLSARQQKEFAKIYDKDSDLTHNEISEIKLMLSKEAAHDYVWKKMREKIEASDAAVKRLGLNSKQQETLLKINEILIPNMKWWDA